MAEFVFTNAHVTINSVDLSDHVRSVTFNYEAEAVESSAMGDTTRERLGGLKDWTVEVEFNQDYASGKVDATLFSLVGATTALAIRPVNTTIAATNPEYQMTGLLTSYNPVGGAHGELAVARATFAAAGAITRDVTP